MNDVEAMERCIQLAREALDRGDHPFGSVLTRDGQIFAEGQNRVNSKFDPTAHAESEVIREACKALETLDLAGFTIYASGEPCWMCGMVIRQVRIERVVIGGPSRWPTGSYTSAYQRPTTRVVAWALPRGYYVFKVMAWNRAGASRWSSVSRTVVAR